MVEGASNSNPLALDVLLLANLCAYLTRASSLATPVQFFLSKELCVRETSYAYAGWRFAEHFLNRLGPEYTVLKEMLENARDDR